MAIERTPEDIAQLESDMRAIHETQVRRADFIQGLRAAADFFETHPDVQAPRYTVMNVFLNTREDMATQARAASWQKEYNDSWFLLRKDFGADLRLEINTQRETVCRKVVTGSEVVPAKPAVPASVRETFEWVCDDASLLAVPS